MALEPKKSGLKAGAKAKPLGEADRSASTAASYRIDERTRSLGEGRAETLTKVCRLFNEAHPELRPLIPWKPAMREGSG